MRDKTREKVRDKTREKARDKTRVYVRDKTREQARDKIIGETRQGKITRERQDTITGERQDKMEVAPVLQDNYTRISVVRVFQCDCSGATFPYWLDDIYAGSNGHRVFALFVHRV